MLGIGLTLRGMRTNRRLTLNALSKRCGVSPSHLARIERGERNVTAKTICKIGTAYGFSDTESLTLVGYTLGESPSIGEDHLNLFIAQQRKSGCSDVAIGLEMISRAKELMSGTM